MEPMKKIPIGKASIWEVIEFPTYAIIVSVIVVQAVAGLFSSGQVVAGIINWVVIIGAFSYIGFSGLRRGMPIGFAAKAGALSGAIGGAAAAVAGIVAFYAFPSMFAQTIAALAEQGIPADQAMAFAHIGVYFSLVVVPALYAGIGALMSALSHWVSR
jgi:hypothetical protein